MDNNTAWNEEQKANIHSLVWRLQMHQEGQMYTSIYTAQIKTKSIFTACVQ